MSPSPLCIVGMHRSGTSLVTRLLVAMGVDIGPTSTLVPADAIDNADGYQEQEPIVRLDDELLRALGGHASEPPDRAPGWELDAGIQSFAAPARELLTELAGPAPWAFKDPRASLLIPFWRSIIPELRVLVCIRNPLEVAMSMDRRGGPYELDHWVRMWQRHTRQALADSEGCARELVVYEDIVRDPQASALQLGRFALGREPDPASLAVAAEMPDATVRDSAIDDSALTADPRVPAEIAAEYFELRERVRRVNTGKSSNVGSIDSRASNPITTQPLAAMLDSRHGS